MITEKTRDAAAERRRKGPRFSANFMMVLEVSRDLVCLCANGLILDINEAGARMLGGQKPLDLIGRTFRDMVGGDYAQVLDELLRLNEIEEQAIPVLLRPLTGPVTEAELTIHPARELGDGHAVVVGRDISRQGHLARTARASEDRFHLLVEKSMHLIAQCHGSKIVYINKAGARMLGAESPAQLQGMSVADIFHGDYREIFGQDLEALLAEAAMIPVRLADQRGEAFDAQIMVTPLPTVGAVPEFMIEARDISGHLRAVAALRRMNETLEAQVIERTRELAEERSKAVEARLFVESLLEAVPNPLWWKGVDGRYRGYNLAFREMHGIGADEWIGKASEETIGQAYVSISADADIRAMEGGHKVQFDGRLTLADGREHDVVVNKIAWRSHDNLPEGIIGVMLDITERKAMEAELRRMATTDVLTGVFNRRHFMTTFSTEVDRVLRHPRPISALMLDIDHFKRINDTFGHPVGDEAIKAMANACQAAIRHVDALGRLGGEEFAIMLPDTDRDAAVLVAERIREAVMAIAIPAEKGVVAFTASIGVAQLAEGDGSAETLLSRADAALYAAKNGGRNRVVAG